MDLVWRERQEGLGDRFKNEVYERIHEIEQHPERYAERKKSYWENND